MSLASKVEELNLLQQKTATLRPDHPNYVDLLGKYLFEIKILEDKIRTLRSNPGATLPSRAGPSTLQNTLSFPPQARPSSQAAVSNGISTPTASTGIATMPTPTLPTPSSSASQQPPAVNGFAGQQPLFSNGGSRPTYSGSVNSSTVPPVFPRPFSNGSATSLFANMNYTASGAARTVPSQALPSPVGIPAPSTNGVRPQPQLQHQNSFPNQTIGSGPRQPSTTPIQNAHLQSIPIEIVELDSDDELSSSTTTPGVATPQSSLQAQNGQSIPNAVLGKRSLSASSTPASTTSMIDLTDDDTSSQSDDVKNGDIKRQKPNPVAIVSNQNSLDNRALAFNNTIFPTLNTSQKKEVNRAIQRLTAEKEKYNSWYTTTTQQWKTIQSKIDNLTSSAADQAQRGYLTKSSKILWEKKNLYSRFKEMIVNEMIKVYSQKMPNYKEYIFKLEESISHMNNMVRDSSNRLMTSVGPQRPAATPQRPVQVKPDPTSVKNESPRFTPTVAPSVDTPSSHMYSNMERAEAAAAAAAARRPSLFDNQEPSPSISTLGSGMGDLDREEIEKLINDVIYDDEDVRPEDRIGTPDCLASTLYEHQKICLKWLTNKEKSLSGGILADDMGLGKTLQIISLIMTDPSPDPACKTTLVIAPVALLYQWEKEFEKHVLPEHRLSVYIHHGVSRKSYSFEQLSRYDVVITSYGVIMSEHKEHFGKLKNRNGQETNAIAGNSPFFQNNSVWYRIILDEAHRIKNGRTSTAVSCIALQGRNRWCLSGTPMQNNVNELQSLIKFLRIKPYDDPALFSRHIGKPLDKGMKKNGQDALKKLRFLLKSIMLRRTKNTLIDNKPILQLPPKTITMDSYDLDEDEREYYDYLENGAVIRMNKYLSDNTISKNYSSILVLLLRLRQACCHPKIVERAYLIKDKELLTSRTSVSAVKCARKLNRMVVNRIRQETAFQCPMCQDACDRSDVVLISPCGHHICSDCCTESFQTSTDDVQNGFRCPTCNILITEKSFFDFIVFKWIYIQNLTDSQIATYRKSYRSQDASQKAQLAAVNAEDIPSFGEEEEKYKAPGHDSDSSSDDDDDDDLFGPKKVKVKKSPPQPVVKPDPVPKTEDLGIKPDPGMPDIKLSSNNRYNKNSAPEEKKTNTTISPPVTRDDLRSIFPDGWISSTKITKCLELIRGIRQDYPGQKILIFSQFMSMLDFIEVALDLESDNIVYGRYDGSMSSEMRARTIDDFTWKPDPSVLLISLKAGNVGLTLTAACHVILMDPFWNPFVEEQAMDRAYRIGQKFPVNVHRVFITHSVEDRILRLQEKKRDLIESALDEKEMKGMSRLNQRELLYLFGLNERGQRTNAANVPQ